MSQDARRGAPWDSAEARGTKAANGATKWQRHRAKTDLTGPSGMGPPNPWIGLDLDDVLPRSRSFLGMHQALVSYARIYRGSHAVQFAD